MFTIVSHRSRCLYGRQNMAIKLIQHDTKSLFSTVDLVTSKLKIQLHYDFFSKTL